MAEKSADLLHLRAAKPGQVLLVSYEKKIVKIHDGEVTSLDRAKIPYETGLHILQALKEGAIEECKAPEKAQDPKPARAAKSAKEKSK